MANNKDCEIARHLISLELDGEINDQQNRILQSHLDICSECRNWESLLQSGLKSIDSDFNEVSGELDELLEANLRTLDLAPQEDIETTVNNSRGSDASKAVLAVVLMVVLLGGLLATMDSDEGVYPVTAEISGQVAVIHEGDVEEIETWESSSIRRSFRVGDQISCQEGTAQLVDGLGFSAEVSFDTKVKLLSPRELCVLDGQVQFRLKPNHGPLKVTTDEVDIFVTGTEFLVRRWASVNRTEVYVLSGEVMVQWGKRIPLPVRGDEWVEVSDGGFMFHSSPEPILGEGNKAAQRPAAGISGQQPEEAGTRLFRDIPTRKVTVNDSVGPLDVPLNESADQGPDGED